MQEFFTTISKELTTTRLEIIPVKDQKQAFNETTLESQLHFNGFRSIQLYEQYLQELYINGKANVNDQISKEVHPENQFVQLEDIHFSVNEFKNLVEWSDISIENYRIEFINNSAIQWEAGFLLKVGKKYVGFWMPERV